MKEQYTVKASKDAKNHVKAASYAGNKEIEPGYYTVVQNLEIATEKFKDEIEQFENALNQFETIFELDNFGSYNIHATLDNLDGMLFELNLDIQDADKLLDSKNPYM